MKKIDESSAPFRLASRVTNYRLAIETAAQHLDACDCDRSHCRSARMALMAMVAPTRLEPPRAARAGLRHLGDQPRTARTGPRRGSGALSRRLRPSLSVADDVLAVYPDEVDLTAREVDVLTGYTRGQSSPQLAASLHVEVTTVKTHAASLYRKLGVHNRADAVSVGLRRGVDTAGSV